MTTSSGPPDDGPTPRHVVETGDGRRGATRHPAFAIGLGLVVSVVLALVAADSVMQPSASDRVTLVAVFAGLALVVAAAAIALRRWTVRLASLQAAVLLTAVGAVAVAAIAIWAAAASMLIPPDALDLVLVALGLGIALGSVLAVAVSQPLQDDLARIRATAQAVAAGRRDVRTGVRRGDEVGMLATTLDDMVVQLDEAERLREAMEAARREFLASVGHDLRTPLTSLRAAIEALQDGLVDDPARYHAAMERDVSTLAWMVDEMFLLSVIESGGLALVVEDVDVAELCDEAVEAVQPVADERDVVVTLDATGPVPGRIATREFGRVVRNLLDNALRHADTAVAVRVRTRPDGAHVAITDDGDGFPAEFVDRVFESFVRADEARRRDGAGAGLGLAIARGLVEAMGGTIRAHPGPGGHVELRLPVP